MTLYKNSRGRTYYLHSRGHLFFFSSDKTGEIEIPKHLEIWENPRTKLPMVRKK